MSELTVIQKTKTPNTIKTIYNNLINLGIKSDDVILVHSSLSAIGWVCGNEATVNYALLKAVFGGTVAMPSHTGDNSDPAEWENPPVPKEWLDEIYASMPAFDKNNTSTRGMGRIAESFRTFPGTIRSNHPQTSFCANGKHSEYITETHAISPQFGMDTPLGKLYSLNAKILLLGVSYSNCTSFHLAECLTNKLPKKKMGASINENGERKWIWFEDIDIDSDDFEQIGLDYEKEFRAVTIGKIGNADCKLFAMKPAVDFAKEWIVKNRKF